MLAALDPNDTSAALALNLVLTLSFAGMEVTFRLFSKDAFGMSEKGTGRVLGLVGLVLISVQGTISVDSVTATAVSGGLRTRYDGGNDVNGRFEIAMRTQDEETSRFFIRASAEHTVTKRTVSVVREQVFGWERFQKGTSGSERE